MTLSSADTHGIAKYARTYARDTHTQAHTQEKKKEKAERLERLVIIKAIIIMTFRGARQAEGRQPQSRRALTGSDQSYADRRPRGVQVRK